MPRPTGVFVFLNPDEIVDEVIAHPLVMIASDGGLRDGKGHPRSAGTYGRILARYVREQGSLSLMDAIRKMSYLPARRLERSTPEARRKGRLQQGADADITVFDPKTVRDSATYEAPGEPTEGINVLVGGTLVVDEGRVVDGVAPGSPNLSATLDSRRPPLKRPAPQR
jgi:N-acyl-D-aspartate/D-glutamate deacylase